MRWLLGSLLLSGCCCFGDFELPDPDYYPPPGDEQEIAAARVYAEQQAPVLLGALDGGAGATGCVSGLGALALDVTLAVASRGHSGSLVASEVRFDLSACGFSIFVLVVWRDHQWAAVGAELRSPETGILGRAGMPLDTFTPYGQDHDVAIDELFD